MSRRLPDHVAIVTGAASGIGRAVAKRFVDEGASVIAVDRDAAVEEMSADNVGAVVGDTTAVATNDPWRWLLIYSGISTRSSAMSACSTISGRSVGSNQNNWPTVLPHLWA